jgi:hypothetical protein
VIADQIHPPGCMDTVLVMSWLVGHAVTVAVSTASVSSGSPEPNSAT